MTRDPSENIDNVIRLTGTHKLPTWSTVSTVQPSTGRVSMATLSSLALYVYSTRSFNTNQQRFHLEVLTFLLRYPDT